MNSTLNIPPKWYKFLTININIFSIYFLKHYFIYKNILCRLLRKIEKLVIFLYPLYEISNVSGTILSASKTSI